jgi:hypothetical protein
MLSRDIQPGVNRCKAEHVLCHHPSGFCPMSYEPVKDYMEMHFLHVLKLPKLYLDFNIGRKAEGCNRSSFMIASSVANH